MCVSELNKFVSTKYYSLWYSNNNFYYLKNNMLRELTILFDPVTIMDQHYIGMGWTIKSYCEGNNGFRKWINTNKCATCLLLLHTL